MAILLSHWRRRYHDEDTRVSRILSRYTESRSQASVPPASKKEKVKFSKPASSMELSLGISRTSTAGNPGAPAAETNQFSVLREKEPTPSSNSLEVKEKPIRGRKPRDLIHPVETTRASLDEQQDVMSSPPNFDEEEGEVTPSDADVHDSIAKALSDALQEKRAGNNFPPTMISVARIRATQRCQYLVTSGREPSNGTIQATLDLISLGQEPSGLTKVADKVFTVSHTLEYTSNQPSTAVPVQINSSSRGRTPTADAEITSVQADCSSTLYTAITNNGNTCPQPTRYPNSECTSSQHHLISFRMTPPRTYPVSRKLSPATMQNDDIIACYPSHQALYHYVVLIARPSFFWDVPVSRLSSIINPCQWKP